LKRPRSEDAIVYYIIYLDDRVYYKIIEFNN